MKRFPIGRRSFLRGLGALLPLPLLEGMFRSDAQAQAAVTPRWGIFYIPNGVYQDDWRIDAAPDGRPALPSFVQGAFGDLLDDLVWVHGLDNPQPGKGDHETRGSTFYSCAPMILPGPSLGKSADQIVADALAANYAMPSLVVSAPGFQEAASCCRDVEVGLNNISWRGGMTPVTKLQDPAAVFDRIFAPDLSEQGQQEMALRLAKRKSILDFGAGQATRLSNRLGNADRARMQEYFDSVREVERRLEAAADGASCEPPSMRPPDGPRFEEHNQLMLDLIFLAFQCNVTPVASFMMDFEFSDRRLNIADVSSGHHTVSHHGEDQNNIRQLRLIHGFYAQRIGDLARRMKSATDLDGKSLLDNSVLTFSAGMSDGNAHDANNVAVVVAGRGGGRITPGRVVSADQPVADLHRTVMELMGVNGPEVEDFGDNTGGLPALLS